MQCPSCMVAVAVAQPQHGIQVWKYVAAYVGCILLGSVSRMSGRWASLQVP